MDSSNELHAEGPRFETPGLRVRLKADRSKFGVTTGRTKQAGPWTMVQVEFGPNDRKFKRDQELEAIPDQEEDVRDLLAQRKWSGPATLRRTLALEKIRGELTDVFYSMESSRTDFYPHQFKPVMKFVESPTGRILIADEVGLGKTIEAIYLWKEIEAREHAKRLLIICPSMLRIKWRDDLQRLFGIEADIVDARKLEERLTRARSSPGTNNFILIASFEAARPPRNYGDDEASRQTNPRAAIGRLLRAVSDEDDEPLIDLVVIDEAHYMRNPSTLTHALGRLLSDASRHLALLTATPVQLGSENLFNLMRLLDPYSFEDAHQFDRMLQANSPVVAAQRHVWRTRPDLTAAARSLDAASTNVYFQNDRVLPALAEELRATKHLSPARRVEIGRRLEARSLISPYITRSRKRDVIPDRVFRDPMTLSVSFSPEERQTYERVTRVLRDRSYGLEGVSVFALISRQRQMASSLPAALYGWHEQDILEEIAWEDFGGLITPGQDELPELPEIDISLAGELEEKDSKYLKLRDEYLRPLILKHPNEKVIIFAFFRGTLTYLQRRLEADGFDTALIMGSDKRSREERNEVLKRFADPEGPSILLSSEVGSEGIDLQFCRSLVNYDLPWNPMRVEQRIGRIDRLGQKAERISIVNLFVEDTIEDRILERLYDRIGVFRETIGDLEQILGDVSEDILESLFNPRLTDEQREKFAEEKLHAIEYLKQEQDRLESQAVNLIGFSDYLMDSINDARAAGRWLSPEELFALVDDFFEAYFPGTLIEPVVDRAHQAKISLSTEARHDLAALVARTRTTRRTRLDTAASPITCVFDPRAGGTVPRGAEIIDPMHPLIRWIEEKRAVEDAPTTPPVAIELSGSDTDIPPGLYAYACQRWDLKGIRRESIIAYQAVAVSTGISLDPTEAERLVVTASRRGQRLPHGAVSESDLRSALECYKRCEDGLGNEFHERSVEFKLENAHRASQQRTSAERLAERKIADLDQRIKKLQSEGKERGAALFKTQVNKQREHLESKLQRIGVGSHVDPTFTDLAGGLIFVTRVVRCQM